LAYALGAPFGGVGEALGESALGPDERAGDRVVERPVVGDRRYPWLPFAEEAARAAGVEPSADEQPLV
jgi:hypothetical protein